MKKLFFILATVFLVGCASWSEVDRMASGGNTMPDEESRRALVASFPALTQSQKAKFIAGKPWIGMSQDVFEALMGGKATDSQHKLSEAGEEDLQYFHERVGDWKTGIRSKHFKAKIRDGKLVEFQELNGPLGNLEHL